MEHGPGLDRRVHTRCLMPVVRQMERVQACGFEFVGFGDGFRMFGTALGFGAFMVIVLTGILGYLAIQLAAANRGGVDIHTQTGSTPDRPSMAAQVNPSATDMRAPHSTRCGPCEKFVNPRGSLVRGGWWGGSAPPPPAGAGAPGGGWCIRRCGRCSP